MDRDDSAILDKYFKQYIEELGINKNVSKKSIQPGGLYHGSDIYPDDESWLSLSYHEMLNGEYSITHKAGLIKPRFIKANIKLKPVVLGWYGVSQAVTSYENFKSFIKPMMLQTLAGLQKQNGFSHEEPNLIGDCYLGLKVLQNGFTVQNMPEAAAYELHFYSDCVKGIYFMENN